MKLLLWLSHFVNRFRLALTDAGREVRKESAHAFVSAFGELKGDAESFASGIKAYSSSPPGTVSSAIRRARPTRVRKR
jgi:hypothetical protein